MTYNDPTGQDCGAAAMIDLDEEGARHVADAVNERLQALGWDQADLVRSSDVSDTIVRRVQRGIRSSYRTSTLSRLSAALWGDGRYIGDVVIAGRTDVDFALPAPTQPVAAPDDRVERLEHQLADLTQRFEEAEQDRREMRDAFQSLMSADEVRALIEASTGRTRRFLEALLESWDRSDAPLLPGAEEPCLG